MISMGLYFQGCLYFWVIHKWQGVWFFYSKNGMNNWNFKLLKNSHCSLWSKIVCYLTFVRYECDLSVHLLCWKKWSCIFWKEPGVEDSFISGIFAFASLYIKKVHVCLFLKWLVSSFLRNSITDAKRNLCHTGHVTGSSLSNIFHIWLHIVFPNILAFPEVIAVVVSIIHFGIRRWFLWYHKSTLIITVTSLGVHIIKENPKSQDLLAHLGEISVFLEVVGGKS